jgi:hypothetical protein
MKIGLRPVVYIPPVYLNRQSVTVHRKDYIPFEKRVKYLGVIFDRRSSYCADQIA